MLPAAAWDEETREGEIMELDLLLGFGLLPPTMAASGGHGDFAAAATAETASAMRHRLPVDVDDGDDDVPAAPPASMLKPASLAARRWPAHATSPAAGRLFVGSRPLVAAGLIAAARSSHDDGSTAPMTVIYAGSVRAYAGVTMAHAEKILAMVAKEDHVAGIGILPVQQAEAPQLELVAEPAQMKMHSGLAHDVNHCHKRTASLARFLNKRKQRAESSAATMDDAPAATVSARTSTGMDRRPRASQYHPKRMKANHAEEADAVSTELKI